MSTPALITTIEAVSTAPYSSGAMKRVRINVPTSWSMRALKPSSMFQATPRPACLATDISGSARSIQWMTMAISSAWASSSVKVWFASGQ